MTKPTYEKQTVLMWDFKDLEELIEYEYNIDKFNLLYDQECGNDCCLKFEIYKKEIDTPEKIEYIQQVIDEYINPKEFMPNLTTEYFLLDLFRKDIIEEGIYIINVCY